MEYTKSIIKDECKVVMDGRFTFSDHLEFKKIFEVFNDNNIKNIEINMKGVEFIDSAALGILLLLRDEAEKKSINLIIAKPQGQVKKMFQISRFYELFKITD